jgi:hypothetical protein
MDRCRIVDRTLGVVGPIKFGETPAKAPDRDGARLKSQIDENGLVLLPPKPFKPLLADGAQVTIAATGPCVGVSAIFAGMSVHQREIVLIAMLPGQIIALRPERR